MRRNARLGPDQFNRDSFTVNHAARTVNCPAGITVTIAPKGGVTFRGNCRGCRCDHNAPPHAMDESLTSQTTTNTPSLPEPRGPTATSPTTTDTGDNSDPCSNAPSPGSSPKATARPLPRPRTKPARRIDIHPREDPGLHRVMLPALRDSIRLCLQVARTTIPRSMHSIALGFETIRNVNSSRR